MRNRCKFYITVFAIQKRDLSYFLNNTQMTVKVNNFIVDTNGSFVITKNCFMGSDCIKDGDQNNVTFMFFKIK